MLGSPFDLSKEIAAIAARRETEAPPKGSPSSTAQSAWPTRRGKTRPAGRTMVALI